jgi:hypothetical protein
MDENPYESPETMGQPTLAERQPQTLIQQLLDPFSPLTLTIIASLAVVLGLAVFLARWFVWKA